MSHENSPPSTHPTQWARPLVYVDCGARGDWSNALVDAIPGAYYVGFEPDPDECFRLKQRAPKNYHYFPVAIGRKAETRILHLTENPACSSLLRPNHAFWSKFLDCAPQIEVKTTRAVQTESLDTYLPSMGIHQADFLELDTQGSELEILRGAEAHLISSTLGIRVEVEFSPLYEDQPLFSDVDAYVRQSGFMLFDLSRHRYRRQNYPRDLPTRGQLLYGHALYLKDYRYLTGPRQKDAAAKLAFIAAFYGFYDYARELLDALLPEGTSTPDPPYRTMLEQVNRRLRSSMVNSRLFEILVRLETSPLSGLLRKTVEVCRNVSETYAAATVRKNYSWSD